MWQKRRGYRGPRATSSSEVLSPSIPAHEVGQIYFVTPNASARVRHSRRPTLVSPLLQFQPTIQMPQCGSNAPPLSDVEQSASPEPPCFDEEVPPTPVLTESAITEVEQTANPPVDETPPTSEDELSPTPPAANNEPLVTLMPACSDMPSVNEDAVNNHSYEIPNYYLPSNVRDATNHNNSRDDVEIYDETSTHEHVTNDVQSFQGYAAQLSLNIKMMCRSELSGNKVEEAELPAPTVYRSQTLRWTMPKPTASALQVAKTVIKHARDNKVANEREMCCISCGLLPVLPVTGECGHTRCMKCINENGVCACGTAARSELHVNTVIQEINKKHREPCVQQRSRLLDCRTAQSTPRSMLTGATLRAWRRRPPIPRHQSFGSPQSHLDEPSNLSSRTYEPMFYQTRYDLGRTLIRSGRYCEAAAHFAHVAASPEPLAKDAAFLLAQLITALSKNCDIHRLTRMLYHGVRFHSASNWLQQGDVECILCCQTFLRPVTTPCGHTYCRECLERSMDYRRTCALCMRSLLHFNLASTGDTLFISAALSAIGAVRTPPPELNPDEIHIFVCTVAYPRVPCPLFIFDPKYCLMVRRVLESKTRQFGMIYFEDRYSYSSCGTMLEIKDCVQLEDGSFILATMGVSRFKVLERFVKDGCDVARASPLVDVLPRADKIKQSMRLVAHRIAGRAELWLGEMDWQVLNQIESTFGLMPALEVNGSSWWLSPDGPDWLWWLICILPLRPEIKGLILATDSLLKRMLAVVRTLEAVEQVNLARQIEAAMQSADWVTRTD